MRSTTRFACLASVTLAGCVIAPAGASAAAYCSPTGDYCTAAARDAGVIKLGLRTFSFRGRYRLCVETPAMDTTCRRFRLRGTEIYESAVRWSRHFPHEGAGIYRVRWHKFGNQLGPTLRFRVRGSAPVASAAIVRPRITSLRWSEVGHNPGVDYYVQETVTFTVCAAKGRSSFRVRELKVLGGEVHAQRFHTFSRRQDARCQSHAVTWRLADEFFGVGAHKLRFSWVDAYDRRSAFVYRSRFTSD